jgi:hypothetical protein
LVFHDFNNDARYIVPGTRVEGQLAQSVGTLLDVGVLTHATEYPVIGNDAMKPVRAYRPDIVVESLGELAQQLERMDWRPPWAGRTSLEPDGAGVPQLDTAAYPPATVATVSG